MTKFRKKPVIIEAEQFTEENRQRILQWITRTTKAEFTPSGKLRFETLIGDEIATVGNWIIQKSNGDFFSCDPHIFNETYEVEN